MFNDPDLLLVTGLILAVLSLPSILSAISDNRSPRVGTVVLVIAGGLIVYALQIHPEGYGWRDIPDAFFRVAARVI